MFSIILFDLVAAGTNITDLDEPTQNPSKAVAMCSPWKQTSCDPYRH